MTTFNATATIVRNTSQSRMFWCFLEEKDWTEEKQLQPLQPYTINNPHWKKNHTMNVESASLVHSRSSFIVKEAYQDISFWKMNYATDEWISSKFKLVQCTWTWPLRPTTTTCLIPLFQSTSNNGKSSFFNLSEIANQQSKALATPAWVIHYLSPALQSFHRMRSNIRRCQLILCLCNKQDELELRCFTYLCSK